ncbi:MAG: hypothetical protein RJA07_875 [Bacteroidota bacterium]
MATKIPTIFFEPEYNFGIIAITATTPDFAICIELDKLFNLPFIKQEALSITMNKEVVEFVWFAIHCDVREIEICLLNNKSDGNFFLKEMRQVDYLLRFSSSDWSNDNLQQIIDNIKIIDGVQAVAKVDVAAIKQKEMLTFEMEDIEYKTKRDFEKKRKLQTNDEPINNIY